MELAPFETKWAETVLSWIAAPQELRYWGARTDFPLNNPAAFIEWHADPGITPYLLCTDDGPVAYGELWLDEAEGTAELGRLVVSPAHRRQGYAIELIKQLLSKARDAGRREIWIRVFPDNTPAILCYSAAGFENASAEQQSALNATQRLSFLWMIRKEEDAVSPT